MGSKKKIALAVAIPIALLMIVAIVVFIIYVQPFVQSFGAFLDKSQQDRTTDTWSVDFVEYDEKISFLLEYITMSSEVLDAEYHIIYQDNSGGLVPGPSYWDIRVALKVNAQDLMLWAEGFEEVSANEVDLAWWDGLETENISWSTEGSMVYYRRPGHTVFVVLFPDQNIVLKVISTR